MLANDTDIDGGPKTIASVTQPANGAVSRAARRRRHRADLRARPELLQRPARHDTGHVHLHAHRRLDRHGRGHRDLRRRPPIAVNDTATVLEDAGATAVDVLANDTDIDGGPKTIASATDPANGTVVLTGGAGAHRADLPARPQLLQRPARHDTGHVHLHAQRRLHRHRVGHGHLRARQPGRSTTRPGARATPRTPPPTVIDTAVTVTDPDAPTTITGATVRSPATTPAARTSSRSPATAPGHHRRRTGDTLTLTGNAARPPTRPRCATVTYRNSSDNPSTATRTVTFTVTDDTARAARTPRPHRRRRRRPAGRGQRLRDRARGRRRHRGHGADQRHRRRRRPEDDRLGHPAGQRHRGDHRRRHRA